MNKRAEGQELSLLESPQTLGKKEKKKTTTGNRTVKNQMHETKPNSRKRLPRKQNPVAL